MVKVPLIGLIDRYLEHTNRAFGHTIYLMIYMPLNSKFELQKVIVAISLQFLVMIFVLGFIFDYCWSVLADLGWFGFGSEPI